MEESELNSILDAIFFFEQLRECYLVKSFYISQDITNLSEKKANKIKLKRLETERHINKLGFKIYPLYMEADRLYHSMIENKITQISVKKNYGKQPNKN